MSPTKHKKSSRSADGKVREEGMLSIGALSRATGIPIETLRTWEKRYGFPVPERKPSGHRVYPISSIPRLRRIAEALTRGHRAGEVVGASERVLVQLLESTGTVAAAPAVRKQSDGETGSAVDVSSELIGAVRAFDTERLTRVLLSEWARMGPLEYLDSFLAPALREVGTRWETGDLEIRHEHFLSERVTDVLRTLRMPFEEKARGPLVISATLSGESHGLGVQMVTLLLSVVGCRTLLLGTNCPVAELASLAKDLGARAVALSFTTSSHWPSMSAQIGRLRTALPKRVAVLLGGEGAKTKPGCVTFKDLHGVERWASSLLAGRVAGEGSV
jgi:methanogenic corrinoid protein MtbC1